MGYTHYWENGEIDSDTFAAIAADTKLAYQIAKEKLGVKVAVEYDRATEDPIFSEDQIVFNGIGDDGHETFALYKERTNFSFCKTARKPYDILVVAALHIASVHAARAKVYMSFTSDGDDADLSAGKKLAEQALASHATV